MTLQYQAELRRQFLKYWHAFVEIVKEYIEASGILKTRLQAPAIKDVREKRTETHKTTLNFLNQYAFAVIKDKLESHSTEQSIQDDTAKTTRELREHITSKGGRDHLVTFLLQNLATVSGKKLEFLKKNLLYLNSFKTVITLRKKSTSCRKSKKFDVLTNS